MDSLVTVDSALVAPLGSFLSQFGVPFGWLAGAVGGTIGYINTFKVLFPEKINTAWYPVAAGVITTLYALALRPNWTAVVAGGLTAWIVQWITWGLLKKSAVAAGGRDR